MLSWWIIGGLLAVAAASGGVAGYAMSRKNYHWRLAYDPYWRRWIWVPVCY